MLVLVIAVVEAKQHERGVSKFPLVTFASVTVAGVENSMAFVGADMKAGDLMTFFVSLNSLNQLQQMIMGSFYSDDKN